MKCSCLFGLCAVLEAAFPASNVHLVLSAFCCHLCLNMNDNIYKQNQTNQLVVLVTCLILTQKGPAALIPLRAVLPRAKTCTRDATGRPPL